MVKPNTQESFSNEKNGQKHVSEGMHLVIQYTNEGIGLICLKLST